MTALDLDHGHAAAALATADTSHSVETPISPTGPADLTAKLARAQRRMHAWSRVVAAVEEMRSALEFRIWREDPLDTPLEADCQAFCELALALTDYLRAKKS